VEQGPSEFKLFSATMMIAGLGFTALFTAGVVNRLLDRRLPRSSAARCVLRTDQSSSSD
jgi:hypothetical protein